ncbi:hypothetical protein TNIN_382011 [Trichonephila inaurata madagascariensis]|uniref:Uncharacterized protein n=1 Tax=Trichonephila inaurata madagascariensis TaxID=2747483 RepID=A0A8X6Y712_9ARAC|nr:hypothetical protein TNIN_382011 [Trichonephila inaurata madagascariensis]
MDQEINLSLANTQLDEKIEISLEITVNKSIQNYEDTEIGTTKEYKIISDISAISIQEDMDAFSSGIDKRMSFKESSPFSQRSNISASIEQTSAYATETPLAKYSECEFYDDNEKKFIINNAEFEEEEKELIDIINSNSEILPSNPFHARGSYDENYHFFPISLDTSPDNSTDEDMKENNMSNNPYNTNLEILPSNPLYVKKSCNEDHHYNPMPSSALPGNFTYEDVKENNMPINTNVEILPTNPFYEKGSYNDDTFIPLPLNASRDNHTDEKRQENAVDSSRKINVFREVKSFFKKLRNDNCNGFKYK